MTDFEGKRVLVTGSSRGIGQATARAFQALGARIAINGRTAASTEAGITALGGEALVAAPGDLGTPDGCRAVVGAAIAQLGGLDILVNSAGVATEGPVEACDDAAVHAMIDVNLKGTFFCIQAALGALRDSGGSIVNVASDAGLIGESGLGAYCASKGGVVVMTKSMALEFAPRVRVNCVCPGYVDTDMVRRDGIDRQQDPAAAEAAVSAYAPMKRMARADEVASAIVYLASAQAGFITGAALQIDGGSTAGHVNPL